MKKEQEKQIVPVAFQEDEYDALGRLIDYQLKYLRYYGIKGDYDLLLAIQTRLIQAGNNLAEARRQEAYMKVWRKQMGIEQ